MNHIIFNKTERIAHIIFNRPEYNNAINLELELEFIQILDEIKSSDDISVVLLSGNGKSFMAGADINVFLNSEDKEKKNLLSKV
jgi:enoyl-CoA hydratase/carnithine racemase